MGKITKEVKIACVAIVGIAILFFGMNFLKGLSIFSNDNMYFIEFDNITGLSPSSPIKQNGFKVGLIKSIKYDYDHPGKIMAEAGIDKELKVPEGSVATITSDLLGNVQVELVLGEESKTIAPGGTIKGFKDPGALGSVKDVVPSVKNLLPKLDSIFTSLNSLLADPHISAILQNVYDVTGELRTSSQKLNSLMAEVNGKVPGLMNKVDGLIGETQTTMGNAKQFTENVAAIDIQGTMSQLQQTLDNMKQFSENLNSDQGSLGKLLHDKTMYDNLNATLLQADSLLNNIRMHPKRYVHFSIFGKKDK